MEILKFTEQKFRKFLNNFIYIQNSDQNLKKSDQNFKKSDQNAIYNIKF